MAVYAELEDDAICVTKCKDLFTDPSFKTDLIFVSNIYSFLNVIGKLETRNLELSVSLSLIDEVIRKIGAVTCAKGVNIKQKLDNILEKNEGYGRIRTLITFKWDF